MNESFGVGRVGAEQDGLPCFEHLLRQATMNHLRCEQADSRMAVFVVVPGKESLTETAGILDGAEAFREIGPVFQRLELGLGEG